jgi:Family of unknown function (DUF6090)
MEQNKTGKYIKYAIGEIVLVVIGILIALSINNWNTDRQNKNIRTQLLLKLDIELQSNIDRLFFLSDKYEELKENNLSLYDTLLIGITIQNAEKYLNSSTYNSSTLNLRSSAYEQMKNTGILYKLSSDSLLNAIEAYYKLCERENYYIIKVNEDVDHNTDIEINKGITKAQYDYDAKGLDYALQNNAWLLNKQSEEYTQLIREFIFITDGIKDVQRRCNRIIDESKSLKQLIREDLDKNTL